MGRIEITDGRIEITDDFVDLNGTFFRELDINWSNTFHFFRRYLGFKISNSEVIQLFHPNNDNKVEIVFIKSFGDGFDEKKYSEEVNERIEAARSSLANVTIDDYLRHLHTEAGEEKQSLTLEKGLVLYMIGRIRELETRLAIMKYRA